MPFPCSCAARTGLAVLVSLVLAACNTTPDPPPISRFETFERAEIHSKPFDTDVAGACEAARRALLSQGYVVGASSAEFVNGRKSFQPSLEMHIELDIRVVCAADGSSGRSTLVFVSGTEERFALRKSSTSASVGVGAIGSLSVPFSSSSDSLVKVGSETITQPDFYERFFALVDRYLTPEEPPLEAPQPSPAPRAD